jgi:hypothetical protein
MRIYRKSYAYRDIGSWERRVLMQSRCDEEGRSTALMSHGVSYMKTLVERLKMCRSWNIWGREWLKDLIQEEIKGGLNSDNANDNEIRTRNFVSDIKGGT